MKKILGLLALTAASFSANAGTVTIINLTGVALTMEHIHVVSGPTGGTTYSGTFSFPISASSTPLFYPNTSALISAVGGPMTPVVPTDMVRAAAFHWGVPGCGIVAGYMPSGFYTWTVTCGGATRTVTHSTSGAMNDVVITIS